MPTQKGRGFMFCPSCGADSQTANAYCKRCGAWLPEFKHRSSAFGGETPQQNIFTGMFMSALSAIVALFSAIALYATYLGSDAKWSIYLAAAFCFMHRRLASVDLCSGTQVEEEAQSSTRRCTG